MHIPMLAMWMPGTIEWIIIAVVALLIFGRRLPEVARSVGKSIVEFKKGIKDVKDDIDVRTRIETPPPQKLEQKPESNQEASPASEPSEEPTSASNKA